MTRYGFKILRAELREGGGRTKLDFADPLRLEEPRSYLDILVEDVRAALAERGGERASMRVESASLSEETVEVGSDDVVQPEGSNQPLSLVRIEKISRLRSAALLEVYFGNVGDHARGIDPQGLQADTDLSKLATARLYRALVVVPTAGLNGFLVVETISGQHLGKRLPRRLDAARLRHLIRLRPQGPVADAGAVERMAAHPRVSEVRLTKTITRDDSEIPGEPVPAELLFKVGAGSVQENWVRDFIARWWPTRANRQAAAVPDSADEAQAIASYFWGDLNGADFDEVSVLVEDGHSKKRLAPLSMNDGFSYEISDKRPSDREFLREVKEVVNALQSVEQVDLDPRWDSPSVGGRG